MKDHLEAPRHFALSRSWRAQEEKVLATDGTQEGQGYNMVFLIETLGNVSEK
jgi:hypothetical protein